MMEGGVSMKIRPLADRVVVKPVDAEEKKQGGIIIPDTAKEKPQQGKIVAVGPGKISETGQKIPMEVKSGDVVLYGKYSGTEVTVDDEDLLIMRESDILAVL
jgi:chaperonin GroES